MDEHGLAERAQVEESSRTPGHRTTTLTHSGEFELAGIFVPFPLAILQPTLVSRSPNNLTTYNNNNNNKVGGRGPWGRVLAAGPCDAAAPVPGCRQGTREQSDHPPGLCCSSSVLPSSTLILNSKIFQVFLSGGSLSISSGSLEFHARACSQGSNRTESARRDASARR